MYLLNIHLDPHRRAILPYLPFISKHLHSFIENTTSMEEPWHLSPMWPGFRLCVTSGLYLLLFVAALRVFLVFLRIVSLQKRLFVNLSLNRKSNGHRFVKRKAIKCCHCKKVDLFRNQNKAELVKTTATQILSTALVVFTLNLFYRSNLVPTTANSLFPR